MPKISIITINLNNVAGLQKTIDSVVGQDYHDFEWIVIDGGSTDGGRELIARYAEYLSYWVSEPDKGIYHAMNKGICASHGDYLLFLSSGDCLYNEAVLSRVVPLLEDRDFYVGEELQGDVHFVPNLKSRIHLFVRLSIGTLPHQSTFIRRQVFSKYGLYREDLRIVSDWYLFYKALIIGNATFDRLRFIISVFDIHGRSRIEQGLEAQERKSVLSEISNVDCAVRFYYENYEIVEALREYRVVFFLFRVYFFFYRAWKNVCKKIV